MKNSTTTIGVIIIAALTLAVVYLYSTKNDLEGDLKHLNKNINTIVYERLNDNSKVVSDSLRVEYHLFSHKLIDSLIHKENEKTIDSLRGLDSNGREQYLISIEKRFGIK
jgi:archaellum component FlaF (FlaF/FlaG flagellin family)